MKILTLAFLVFVPWLAGGAELDNSFGKTVEQCGVKGAKSHVWIFKQWHLSPNVNTKKDKLDLPQLENQRAIYDQIAKWIDNKSLTTIYSEGCTGEITGGFSRVFNGWTLKDLAGISETKDYDRVLTLIPLKFKAKYHDQVKVYCADDDNLIQKQNEALSDARGNLGFLSRIQQFKGDPQRVKPFLEKIVELDHLAPDTTPDQAIKKIRDDIDQNVSQALADIKNRNEKFVAALNKTEGESAFVVGGLHAKGLVELLKKNQIDCTVVEPNGYHSEDEKIISGLESSHK